ncbi:MAG: FkbM family methyltransferase [Deltaproteobacteria bacterium]|nr:FkbM family methyltransferase [Deltaproteobacteria bacterium]
MRSPRLRRLTWRVGRRIYTEARGEVVNVPATNGEHQILAKALDHARAGQRLLDIGAKLVAWTVEARRLGAVDRGCRLHPFEPTSATRALLTVNVGDFAHVHAEAVSDAEGRATLYSSGAAAGSNSLTPAVGSVPEEVAVTTIDAFLAREGDPPVLFVKIDTEGFDALVLRGAQRTLARAAVEVVQFEYNQCRIANRLALRDVFELLETIPYRLGKLVGERLEFYDAWHYELDRFVETNFVLVKRGGPLERLGVAMRFDESNTAVPR